MAVQTPAQAMRKAIDIINERGWKIGGAWGSDRHNAPVCMVSALRAAVSEDGSAGFANYPNDPYLTCRIALVDVVGGQIPEFWNDWGCEDQAHAVRVMERAAQVLEESENV